MYQIAVSNQHWKYIYNLLLFKFEVILFLKSLNLTPNPHYNLAEFCFFTYKLSYGGFSLKLLVHLTTKIPWTAIVSSINTSCICCMGKPYTHHFLNWFSVMTAVSVVALGKKRQWKRQGDWSVQWILAAGLQLFRRHADMLRFSCRAN